MAVITKLTLNGVELQLNKNVNVLWYLARQVAVITTQSHGRYTVMLGTAGADKVLGLQLHRDVYVDVPQLDPAIST